MKKKLSLLIVAFMALAAYAGLNAWRTAGETVTDELTWQGLGLDGTTNSYKSVSGKTFTSKAVYQATAATNNGAYIQIKAASSSGIVTTASGGKLKKIIVEWNDETVADRTLDIYGSNKAYSSAADLFGSNKGTKLGSIVKGTSTELTVDGDYTFVGLRSNSGAMFLNKISIVWEPPTYTVAGAVMGGDGNIGAGFFGTQWDPTNTANDMTEDEGGVFVKKYENLDLSVCQISFKVATNHAWSTDGSTDYPSDNYTLSVSKAGKYDLTITFNPTNKEVNAQLEAKETEPTITSMEIRGTFPGMSWDADGAVAMTQVAGSTTQWIATMENVVVEATTYKYKAFANHVTDGYQLPASGDAEFAFGTEQYPAGTYNLKFTVDTGTHSLAVAPEKVEEPEPTITSMEIRGTFPGMSWDADGAVAMTQVEGDPTAWTVTVENVEVEAKTYEYKAYANHETTGFQLPSAEEGNASFTFGTEQYPAGKYNLRFIASTQWNRFEMVPTKVTEPEPPTEEAIYYAVGVADLWGVAWAKADNNKLTKGEDGKYSLTKTGLTLDAGTYGYKVLKVVGETETWIPEGGGTEKLLTIEARAVYSVTLTLDATDPITADSYLAVATKTGEAGTDQPATITKVQICGATDAGWTNRIDFDLNLADPNVYYNKLDATEYTEDVEFKLVVNESVWKGVGEFEKIEDPHGLLDLSAGSKGNFKLKNSNGVYKTYGFKAHWKENPDAGAGWSLEVLGIDKRETTPEPTTPDFIVVGNNAELFGAAWDIQSTANNMELVEGKYYKKYTNVQPQETNIELKAYNKTNGAYFGNTKDGGNVVFNMKDEGDFTVVLDVNADFTEGRVWIEGENVEMITPQPDQPEPEAVYYAVGVEALWGANWAPADANKLTKGEDGKYSVTKTGLTLDAGTYGYKVLKVVGETQTWIPEGGGTEKLLTIDARAVYSVTLTLDATDPITADSYLAVATKTGEAGTDQPATISKVQICGATDAAWTNRIDFELNSAAPEQPNTYYNVLDATAYTDDVEFKLVVNESEWLGIGRFEKIEDPEGLVDQTTNVGDGKSYNFILKNSNGKYQKYDFKASWKENPDAGAGWTLEVLGKEARAEQPGDATWTVAGDNTTLFGEAWNPAFTANDMVKQEDGTYKWEKTEQTLAAGAVEFKVVKNHSWDDAYPEQNYKLAIPEDGKYTVTITFDAEKKEVAATATKTGEAIIPDAEITSVQLPGDWGWNIEKGEDGVEPKLVLTKGEDNTWTGVLDLTEVTTDQKFKLVVNKKEWLGLGELTLNAGELVSTETDKDNNFILLNATSGYQTYDVTATWEANASAKAGWTLTIAGKDERPVVTEPVYTLVGAFYDGEGKESASFFGESWKVLEANNLEKIYDGFYKKEYTGINLEKGNVSLKVLKDGDWDHPYPNADGYLLEIPSAGVYDLTFTFHPDQSVVRGEADKKSDPIEITRMDIVGDFTGGWPSKDETSGEWDWSKAKAMTQDATNPAIWTLTVEDFKAEAKTYEYKATANGQYGVYELPASGNNNWVFGTEAYPAGKYDLLFTANTADNSLTVAPTLKEVETVILDEEETLAENQVLEVDEPFTSDEITVEDGQIITIEADEAGESLVPRRAFRALAASDITIQYKPEAGSDWQDAPVTVETNETGYQFEVTGAVATAINDRGFAIKANKPIVVTQVAVVTEVTPDPEPEPVYYAVGVKALWGVNDWTVDEANKLTLNGEGKYTITKTELTLDANTNYGYKVVKKVGDTQYWIPDGMNNEKNLTVTERAVYSVTLTLDPAEPLTVDSYLATATKTGEADPAPDAEITKVEIRGSFNGWDTPTDGLVMTKQGETNTYTATLDLTEITEDVQFKLVLNNKVDWLGWGELELVAPENWTAKEDGTGNNIVLKNASTGYKTYTLTATWTPGPVAKTGWKLEIAGKDERPAVPATITKVELRGEFTSWSDGEGVELTKQGETDTYAGVLDLSEITADQAFKLVINDKTYWIDFNHLSLVAPDGWLVKESGEVTEPAIILTNSSTGYKTYDITATWTPSPDAAAGWTLTVAGKDLRPVAEDTYTVFGAFYDGEGEHASILTKTWDPTATENDMVKGDGNVYTKTYADAELTAGTFQLKVAKNHNDATSYPEGYGVNYELPIAAAGKYDVVVTFNADTKEVTAVATPKDVPEANYYIVGSMTDWQIKEAYKLTVNEAAEAGVVEYMITINLTKDDQFKIAKSDDGIHVNDADWYPTGMDNNYKITKTSNYTVYFRPNGDGGDDWHYHYIYAQDNNPTGINGVKADALKDAEVYTINGQRVQNPTKGLYIVNGKKVVIK